MFEKEAEEIANKRCHEIMCYGHCSFSSPKHHRCGEWHREYNCAKEGIEFGYNKANEWHYVKDGDLPKDDKQYLVLFSYNYKGKQEMSCGVRDNLHSDFEINRCYTEQIIAWKEIVLPELKESK
jgi:hypothetical protein